MTRRVLKNLDYLKALHCSQKVEKEQLLKHARAEIINAICDCAKNILLGNIDITSNEKKRLQPKKNVLRKLADRKTKFKDRKKLLVQNGSGLLTALLAPVITTLASGILSKV